jgi:hypothetical protein
MRHENAHETLVEENYNFSTVKLNSCIFYY